MSENTTCLALESQVCALFLLCQKNSSLYPPEHPRVKFSLAELREAIVHLHQETGRSFLIETIPADEPAVEKSSKGFRDLNAMRRLLMAQFIESITIAAKVEERELGELCTILREDLLKSQDIDKETINFSPLDWDDVNVQYFRIRDLPSSAGGTETLVEKLAGLEWINDINDVVPDLPEATCSALKNALRNPEFL